MSGRNGARPKRKKQPFHGKPEEKKMVELIDQINDFEEFRENFLPALRRDLKAGMKPEEIRKKYASLVQARTIMTAITSDDARAMAAAKDILDRQEGKATEKKEVIHRYADLKDEELDAILESEENDLKRMESNLEH